jgi:hypothetical protein
VNQSELKLSDRFFKVLPLKRKMKVLLHSDVALWSPPEEPKMGCTIGGALMNLLNWIGSNKSGLTLAQEIEYQNMSWRYITQGRQRNKPWNIWCNISSLSLIPNLLFSGLLLFSFVTIRFPQAPHSFNSIVFVSIHF